MVTNISDALYQFRISIFCGIPILPASLAAGGDKMLFIHVYQRWSARIINISVSSSIVT